MSANILNSTDEATAAASDFRIAVVSVPDDLEPLGQVRTALPDMDRATSRLQTHLLPGIIPHSYRRDIAAGIVIASVPTHSLGPCASRSQPGPKLGMVGIPART